MSISLISLKKNSKYINIKIYINIREYINIEAFINIKIIRIYKTLFLLISYYY